MSVVEIIFGVVLLLFSIAIILVVLLQEGNQKNVGVVTGAADTFLDEVHCCGLLCFCHYCQCGDVFHQVSSLEAYRPGSLKILVPRGPAGRFFCVRGEQVDPVCGKRGGQTQAFPAVRRNSLWL